MTISPKGTAASQPPMTRPAGVHDGPARGGSDGRLNEDEWQFLRATPDYDAEEMASVALPPTVGCSGRGPREEPSLLRVGCSTAPAAETDRRTAPSPTSPAHFPEAENLVSMLGELMETQPRGEGGSLAAAAAWSEVPAAEEWADLMGPHAAEPSPAQAQQAAPPPTHDVLLDALAAGERLGIFENRAR